MKISRTLAVLLVAVVLGGALVVCAAKTTQPYVIRGSIQSGGNTQSAFSLPAKVAFGPDQNLRIEVRSSRPFSGLVFTGLQAKGCSVTVGETWRSVEKSGRFQLGYSARVVVVNVDTPGTHSGTFRLHHLQPVY